VLLTPVYKKKNFLEKAVSLMLGLFTSFHNSKCGNSSRNLEFIWGRNAEPEIINFSEYSLLITEIKNTFGKLQMGSLGVLRKCEPVFQTNQL